MNNNKILIHGKDNKATAQIQLLECDEMCKVNETDEDCRLEVIADLFDHIIDLAKYGTAQANKELRDHVCDFITYISGGDFSGNSYMIHIETKCEDCIKHQGNKQDAS